MWLPFMQRFPSAAHLLLNMLHYCQVFVCFVSAALALIVRVLVLFSLKCVVKNFGHGLKESG